MAYFEKVYFYVSSVKFIMRKKSRFINGEGCDRNVVFFVTITKTVKGCMFYMYFVFCDLTPKSF